MLYRDLVAWVLEDWGGRWGMVSLFKVSFSRKLLFLGWRIGVGVRVGVVYRSGILGIVEF